MTSIIKENCFYVVLGLGKTGSSIIAYLAQKKIKVYGLDTRLSPPNIDQLRKSFSNVNFILGHIDHDLLDKCSLIVTSPGFKYETLKKKYNHKIVSDVELFSREAKAPIIAVTGTNGKSTVTSLVGLVLQSAGFDILMGGNLGEPVLDLLKKKNPDYFVLELSSFQLENTYSLKPLVGAVTNISIDHLDRHSSFSVYQKIKESLLQSATNIVVCRDEPWTLKYLRNSNIRTSSLCPPDKKGFGILQKEIDPIFSWGSTPLFRAKDIKIHGEHNWLNVLTALAIISNCTVLNQRIFSEIKKFSGLPHRAEFVSRINGITFINDSKATNISSAIATMNSFFSKRKGVLIAGGLFKGGNLSEFVKAIEKFCHSVVLIGSSSGKIESVLPDKVFCKVVTSVKKAVHEAGLLAQCGDTVLLAPACSSLDMFESFEHRGDVFKKAVAQWRSDD